jgi:hypothetical protein
MQKQIGVPGFHLSMLQRPCLLWAAGESCKEGSGHGIRTLARTEYICSWLEAVAAGWPAPCRCVAEKRG